MCSFLFTYTSSAVSDETLVRANRFARHRGPDRTVVERSTADHGAHVTFLHNLLDISGTGRRQPVSDSRHNRLLFNGEIYNFRDFGPADADTDCLLPLFSEEKHRLGAVVEGEFSMLVYAPDAGEAWIYTDPFLTKPLFFGTSPGTAEFGAATCASSLSTLGFTKVEMAEPNSMFRIPLGASDPQISPCFPVTDFSTDQETDSWEEWDAAFLSAIRCRATHGAHRPAVFLSSGYDSGAICAALNELDIEYETFSISGGENEEILAERIRINRAASCRAAHLFSGLETAAFAAEKTDLLENVEPFTYHHEDSGGRVSDLHSDFGAIGANFLSRKAREAGCLVNLSGSGADEILSDYGYAGERFYSHSEFGGQFPDDLSSIFPWRKFYGDTQRSYLFKDEYVLGRHGLEGRYPFLDKAVVQAFLSTTARRKNEAYKAPLARFLEDRDYPFEAKVKRGFIPLLADSAASAIESPARRGWHRFGKLLQKRWRSLPGRRR